MLPILVIAGPTGTGKSRLALHVACKYKAEIISADSRQVYRYMDIGTGKPTREEQDLVPHHMIDVVDPDRSFSAGEYGRRARSLITDLLHKGTLPILVGGTGLYIRAAIDGLAPLPPTDPEIKASLIRRWDQEGGEKLFQELFRIDPAYAERIHPNDRQRILRGLEVFRITGRPLADFHKRKLASPFFKTLFFYLDRPRDALYAMIDRRVEKMFEQGLVGEVRSLLERGYTLEHPGMQSMGYAHVYGCLKGDVSLSEAKRLMKRDTRRYAKRQITWFGQEKRAIRLHVPGEEDILCLAPALEDAVDKIIYPCGPE